MVYGSIPEKHVEILREFYETTPHRGVPLSTDDFVDFIARRIHVEFLRNVFDQENSRNPGLRQFIEDEAYLEGIRMEQNGGNSPDLWQTPGEVRRLRITLQRLVNRTIILFRQTGGDVNTYGINGELNLRCDLSRYD